MIIHGVGLLILAAILLAGLAAHADEPAIQQALDKADVAALAERIDETKHLLGVMDTMIAQLTEIAQSALDHADSAATVEERSNYESLYSETSARLGELQVQRDEIDQLLKQLAHRLEPLQHGK